MLRIVLFNFAMFLLPFLVYGLYVYATRQGDADAGEVSLWQNAPWGWLFGIGLLLMAGGIAMLISFTGAPPGGTYIPPRMEDGVIKPGRIE